MYYSPFIRDQEVFVDTLETRSSQLFCGTSQSLRKGKPVFDPPEDIEQLAAMFYLIYAAWVPLLAISEVSCRSGTFSNSTSQLDRSSYVIPPAGIFHSTSSYLCYTMGFHVVYK
jgi:hypothetical protein